MAEITSNNFNDFWENLFLGVIFAITVYELIHLFIS